MRIKPEELKDQGYSLILKVRHSETVAFINSCLSRSPMVAGIYVCILMVLVIAISFVFFLQGWNGFGSILKNSGILFGGLVLSFGLAPVHEYLHIAAYKVLGAQNTKVVYDLKKCLFLAVAPGFVVSRIEFVFIALAPFITISALFVPWILQADHVTRLFLLGILLGHTSVCAGDFGMLGFYREHRDKTIVVYDDLKRGAMYFYGKEPVRTRKDKKMTITFTVK